MFLLHRALYIYRKIVAVLLIDNAFRQAYTSHMEQQGKKTNSELEIYNPVVYWLLWCYCVVILLCLSLHLGNVTFLSEW